MFAAILGLISIPVRLLNFGGGIVGIIWLAVLGKWSLLGIGLISIFIFSFGLPLALVPAFLFAASGRVALEREKYVIGFLCLTAGNLWTLAVMTVWCVSCFYVALSNYYSGGSIWPYLLWAYGMATSPLAHMAAKKGETGSIAGAFGVCIGAIAIIGVLLFWDNPTIVDVTIAFCIPLFAVLVFQTLSVCTMAREEARNSRLV